MQVGPDHVQAEERTTGRLNTASWNTGNKIFEEMREMEELYNDGKIKIESSYVPHCGTTLWNNGRIMASHNLDDALIEAGLFTDSLMEA